MLSEKRYNEIDKTYNHYWSKDKSTLFRMLQAESRLNLGSEKNCDLDRTALAAQLLAHKFSREDIHQYQEMKTQKKKEAKRAQRKERRKEKVK